MYARFTSSSGSKKGRLLLGNESHGLPEAILHMADEKWSIPGSGKADS